MPLPQKIAIFIAGWVPIIVLWFLIAHLATIFYAIGAILTIAYIYYLGKVFERK